MPVPVASLAARSASEPRPTPGVRVVSIPADHPYVRGVTFATGIVVLSDPPTTQGSRSQWWPPVALDPDWILAHASQAELLHIHFGTESFPPSHLSACLAAAREVGWPVVFTVHDIDHPQLAEQSAYHAQLDVLVPGADAVITLTEGAATRVLERWERSALVVPHPALYTSAALPSVPESDRKRIGVFLKDLRPNVDAVGIARALVGALPHLAEPGADAVAEVHIHRQVRDEASRDAVRTIVSGSDHIVLLEHDRLSDKALASELARLDVCVLPYGHGTHSGWLELCWDLAVPLVVPSVGFFAEQHPDPTVAQFSLDESGASLESALDSVLMSPTSTRPGSAERARAFDRRRAQRAIDDAAAAATHLALYRHLVEARRS